MNINEIREFLRTDLPNKILNQIKDIEYRLSEISPFYYIIIIIILIILLSLIYKKVIKKSKIEKKKSLFIKKLCEANSIQEYTNILIDYFKVINPNIKNVGIYLKDNNLYKLSHTDYFDTDIKEKVYLPETFTSSAPGYEKIGRLHIYTHVPPNRNFAIRLASSEEFDLKTFMCELEYLSSLIQSSIEIDSLKSELIKTKLLNGVKDLFSSASFNKENYFRFIGNIIMKAINLDGVKILFNDKTFSLGSFDENTYNRKLLKVRNTNIDIELFKKIPITQNDISNTGKFLDLISAMFSFYTNQSLLFNYILVLETAVNTFEEGDPFYKNHSQKVKIATKIIAENLGLNSKQIETLDYAARLHDIGMIGDINEISLKDIRFSEKEFGIIKFHPLIGYTITTPIDFLLPISEIILQHHELLDGSGYPNGLKSNNILQESKILSFCEILVGLLSERPHRKAFTIDEAISQISTLVPKKIDQSVFKTFIDNKEQIIKEFNSLT